MPDNGAYERTALAAVAAHNAVTTAQQNRSRAVRTALAAGHSTRSLAPLLGVGHNSIARWARACYVVRKADGGGATDGEFSYEAPADG
jgi:transposase-like protein